MPPSLGSRITDAAHEPGAGWEQQGPATPSTAIPWASSCVSARGPSSTELFSQATGSQHHPHHVDPDRPRYLRARLDQRLVLAEEKFRSPSRSSLMSSSQTASDNLPANRPRYGQRLHARSRRSSPGRSRASRTTTATMTQRHLWDRIDRTDRRPARAVPPARGWVVCARSSTGFPAAIASTIGKLPASYRVVCTTPSHSA